jgi:pimeloyl-ACP methyl ester carboxylesterase
MSTSNDKNPLDSPYPIIENDPTFFPFFTLGKKSNKVIVLCSGFPDDCYSSWGQPVLEDLSKDYFVISICLPGYAKKVVSKWGHSFPTLIAMMNATIHSILGDDKRPFILIGHDWGSIISQKYENTFPGDLSKLILLDIGQDAPLHPLFLLYTIWFAVSYILTATLGQSVGDFTMKMFFALCLLIPISPSKGGKPPRRQSEINSTQLYPYFQMYKAMLTGNAKSLLARFPTTRTLFMYGAKTRVPFHGKEFISKLKKSNVSKWIEVDSGHWLQRDQTEIFLTEVKQFIEAI